jgi:hypothetical protein
MTLESSSPLLLGRCSRQLRKSCADANMHSRAERMFILEYYFASKSFAAVLKVFTSNNAYPDKEVPNKTEHRMVTRCYHSGNTCLIEALIERQNNLNCGCADFKQSFSRKNGIRLREYKATEVRCYYWFCRFVREQVRV